VGAAVPGVPARTDNIGADILSRVIWGAQVTILVAGARHAARLRNGVVLGFLAAVTRGWLDQLISRRHRSADGGADLIFALVVLSVLPTDIYI